MHLVEARVRLPYWLVSLTACLLLMLAAFAAIGTSPSHADCTTGGSGCLPGSGYTFNQNWNCGPINSLVNEYCYYNETKSYSEATLHTWGWGSAAYNGTGSTWVCIFGDGHFEGCASNLARACYEASCNDQESSWFRLYVGNWGEQGASHTVWGHGEA